MRFDLRRIQFPTNEWFSDHVEYRGWGRACFSHPRGVLEGQITITVDQAGGLSAEMTEPVVAECERELRFGLPEFLGGQEPELAGDHWRLGIGLDGNPCDRLEVQTPDGTLVATDDLTYSSTLLLPPARHTQGGERGASLAFDLLFCEFEVAGAGVATYWALPLVNFTSRFLQRVRELGRHPLRLRPVPDVPEEVDPDERDAVDAWLQLRNTLIAFDFAGNIAFIEPLSDYKDRESRLRAGQDSRLITAVMVGSTGANETPPAGLPQWLPVDFLPLLGLATGSDVGAAWVEIMDGEGRLARRLHYRFLADRFSQGHRSIDEVFDGGTGRLLVRAQATDEFGRTEVRVAIEHLIRANDFGKSIEDRFDHICRGIDGLAGYLHLTHLSLLDRLTGPQREVIRGALREASDTIRAVADGARASGDEGRAVIIEGIGNRAAQSPFMDASFGWAVTRLVDHFGLADNHVMARHFGGEDGLRRWATRLSALRGNALHGRFFNITGGEHNIDDLWQTAQHLLDILTRVLLRSLGYDGTYQPHVLPYAASRRTDWVAPESVADDLGYH
jgi:hypothetical protein